MLRHDINKAPPGPPPGRIWGSVVYLALHVMGADDSLGRMEIIFVSFFYYAMYFRVHQSYPVI